MRYLVTKSGLIHRNNNGSCNCGANSEDGHNYDSLLDFFDKFTKIDWCRNCFR